MVDISRCEECKEEEEGIDALDSGGEVYVSSWSEPNEDGVPFCLDCGCQEWMRSM